MIYYDSKNPCWPDLFRPGVGEANEVRHYLNAFIRHGMEGQTARSYLYYLINSIHNLAIAIPEVAIVSTCKKFVCMPTNLPSGIMAVDIKPIVTNTSQSDLNLPAWADIVLQWNKKGRPTASDLLNCQEQAV